MKPKKIVKAVVETLVGRARYVALFSDEQTENADALSTCIASHRDERESFTLEARLLVDAIFPAGREPIKADWVEFVSGVAEEVALARDVDVADETAFKKATSYAKKCIRDAYTAGGRELPSAGDGEPGARKPGSSPKKSAKGLQSRVLDLVNYVAALDARNINANVLRKVTAAVQAMAVAADAFAKAANE